MGSERVRTELLWWKSPCNAVQITVAAHDTTGGMAGKISEAAVIAAMGIDVYIVQVLVHILPHPP